MKKIIVSLIVALSMAGCANQPQQTPAQVAARVCPAAQSTIKSLQDLQGLPTQDVAALTKVAPLVTAACTAAEGITDDNIRSLAQTAIPALSDIVAAFPATSDKDIAFKNTAIIDLGAAQIIVDGYLAAVPAPVTTAPAPASK